METALSLVVGCLFAVALYLLLSKHIIRMLLGVVLLGNAVNILIFTAGRITSVAPPLIPGDASVPLTDVANPLPQALVLTAIVITFGMTAFVVILALRSFLETGSDHVDGHDVPTDDQAGGGE